MPVPVSSSCRRRRLDRRRTHTQAGTLAHCGPIATETTTGAVLVIASGTRLLPRSRYGTLAVVLVVKCPNLKGITGPNSTASGTQRRFRKHQLRTLILTRLVALLGAGDCLVVLHHWQARAQRCSRPRSRSSVRSSMAVPLVGLPRPPLTRLVAVGCSTAPRADL